MNSNSNKNRGAGQGSADRGRRAWTIAPTVDYTVGGLDGEA